MKASAVGARVAPRKCNPLSASSYFLQPRMHASFTCALFGAVRRDDADTVCALLADGRADPSVCDSHVLFSAAEHGSARIVAALLADGLADPAARRHYALIVTAGFGRADVVAAFLADPRTDPTTDHNYALRTAAYKGHTGVVAALLADGRAETSRALGTCALCVRPMIQRAVRWQRRRPWLRACSE